MTEYEDCKFYNGGRCVLNGACLYCGQWDCDDCFKYTKVQK